MTTFLVILAIVVAAIAFAFVWRLQQEMQQVTRRLDRYNRSLFDSNEDLHRLREELQALSAAIHVEQRLRTGAPAFTPETTLREAGLIHPQALQVLKGHHVGSCANCAAEPDDTLAQICDDKGVDMPTLLSDLNSLAPVSNGGVLQPLKLPNVKLELS